MSIALGEPMVGTPLLLQNDAFIRPLRSLDRSHIPIVGGKNANLGELLQHLTTVGVRVPDGFAIVADAFRQHLRDAHLDDQIYATLDRLDLHDVAALARAGRAIREQVRSAPLPAEIERELRVAYDRLSRQYGEAATDVAVRSSATAEDLPEASFAGQQESYLNVRGYSALVEAVRSCLASMFTDRAILYRAERGYPHRAVALSVGVQKMVRSDLASAGVIFTLDPETGFRDVVHIAGAWGLGETVVKGEVNPDEITIHKPTLARGFRSIVRRDAGDKLIKLVYAEGAGASTQVQQVASSDRRRLVLTDDEALALARWAISIEEHYGIPMDIEWAKDGRTNEMYIVQARPETVHTQATTRALDLYRL
jgi:pyruvate,water dikinase